MISVIIPVVNESETVGRLVASVGLHPEVEEVIVVDDGSIDDTPNLAREAGARVITSTFLGKGASLNDGLRAAKNKIVLFLDAHLRQVPAEVITGLTEPLHEGKVKLTLADYAGSLGPVCSLTARPLVRTFFPELNHIDCPVSGLWAARRSLLQKLPFELDHGVEIGLLLDAVATGATIEQIKVGDLEAKEETPEFLAEIAEQVTRTILNKAAAQHRLKASYLKSSQENEYQSQTDLMRVLRHTEPADRLALFDMDGVLIHGDFVVELAYQLGKGAELSEILDADLEQEERIQKIAALFAGVPRSTLEEVAHEMPLMPGARETVAALRKQGYLVGIVSDYFHVAAEIIRCRVFGDFSIAHLMKYQRGKATGRVTLAPAMLHPHGCPLHKFCKANIIHHLNDMLHVPAERVLAVGNSENDVCMLQTAGLSVAFRSSRSVVRTAATHVLEGALSDLLEILQEQPAPVAR